MEREGLIMFEEKNNTIDGVIFERITKFLNGFRNKQLHQIIVRSILEPF